MSGLGIWTSCLIHVLIFSRARFPVHAQYTQLLRYSRQMAHAFHLSLRTRNHKMCPTRRELLKSGATGAVGLAAGSFALNPIQQALASTGFLLAVPGVSDLGPCQGRGKTILTPPTSGAGSSPTSHFPIFLLGPSQASQPAR